MRFRTAYASLTVVALIAAAIVALPFSGDDHPGFPVLDPLPTTTQTIGGVPKDEAPPRTVVEVDRAVVAAVLAGTTIEDLIAAAEPPAAEPDEGPRDEDAPDEGQRDDGPRDDGPRSDSDAGPGASIEARTGTTGTRELDPDRLSDSDRELLAALGLLDAAETAQDTPDPAPPTDTPAAEPLTDAPDPAQPDEAATSAVRHDISANRALAAELAALLTGFLDTEVEVRIVIGDRFTVIGATPEQLHPLPFITAAQPTAYLMLAAEGDTATYDGIGSSELRFGQQWGLYNTGQSVPATEEIDGTLGAERMDIDWVGAMGHGNSGRGVVVAVLDTPIDTTHPELRGRIWQNPGVVCGETGEEETDIAGDCHGWNFVDDDWRVSSTGEHANHGTVIAGIIAAGLHGGEIAGVAPNTSIMPVVIAAGLDDALDAGNVAAAIRYAVDNGADIINASFAAPFSERLTGEELSFGNVRDALAHARDEGVLVVASAGNHGMSIDQSPTYPASYAWTGDELTPGPLLENLLAVTAIDHTGALWEGEEQHGRTPAANWGSGTVHVAAPGSYILSATAGGGLAYQSGTSVAVPHAVGVAAMLLDREPDLSPKELRDAIRFGARRLDSLDGKVSDGLLSASGALAEAGAPTVVFSNLGGSVAPGATRADLHTTVTMTLEDDGVTELDATLSLATHIDGKVHRLVDHPITVSSDADGIIEEGVIRQQSSSAVETLRTDEEAFIGLSLTRDEGASTAESPKLSTTLSVELPEGDYAWVLEFDDESAYVGPFHVGPAEELPEDSDDEEAVLTTAGGTGTSADGGGGGGGGGGDGGSGSANDSGAAANSGGEDSGSGDDDGSGAANSTVHSGDDDDSGAANSTVHGGRDGAVTGGDGGGVGGGGGAVNGPMNDGSGGSDGSAVNSTVNGAVTGGGDGGQTPGTGPELAGPVESDTGNAGDRVTVHVDTSGQALDDVTVTFGGFVAPSINVRNSGPHSLSGVVVPTGPGEGTVDVVVRGADGFEVAFEAAFTYLSSTPSEAGAEKESTPGRTTGKSIRLSNGLTVVEATARYPISQLPSSLWAPSCTTNCSAMHLRNAG